MLGSKAVSSTLIPNVLLIGLHHKSYWIKLSVQRIFGSIFSLTMRNNNLNLTSALGLAEPKDIVSIMHKLVNVFKHKPLHTEELGN